jgi:hypothetical protein
MSDTSRDAFIVAMRNAQVMEVQARELLQCQSERVKLSGCEGEGALALAGKWPRLFPSSFSETG